MHTQKRIKFNREALKKYRIHNNLTQNDLAERIETSTNVISYWETGRRTPMPGTVDKLVQVTGIPHRILHQINEETLGTKLTTMRLSQNISQIDMAKELNTSSENINRWEADKHVPSAYFIYQLAKALGVTVEELITNEKGEIIIEDPHR